MMKKQSGRKAFILLSDGGDVRSKASIGTAIEYAQRADTLIYSVVFEGSLLPAIGPRIPLALIHREHSRNTMRRLAEETGGRYFEVSKDQSISQIYREIEDEMRNQYTIAYTSDRKDGSQTYRKISLTLDNASLTAQTRPGYYPK
jgi:VWFA-related protein